MLKESVLTCTLASSEFGHHKPDQLVSAHQLRSWILQGTPMAEGANQHSGTTWYHSPSQHLPVLFPLWKTSPHALWPTPSYSLGLILAVTSFLKPSEFPILDEVSLLCAPTASLPPPWDSPPSPLPLPQSGATFSPFTGLIP